MRSRKDALCRAAVAMALAVAPAAWAQVSSSSARALEAYVAKPDASYEWEVRGRYAERDADILELTLRSQTWRATHWKHQLFLIKPEKVTAGRHALLIIGGGRWRDEYERAPPADELPDDADVFLEIARRLETIVVVVGQVPFQPLFRLTEDRLIAHTFDQYLRTGDSEWPLLLPMVKSAVRAMDAGADAAAREWGLPLETFTALGGSKRGWTSWLLAAVDPRVRAVAPVVIDALNMERHFAHQTETWGAPSEEIRPYVDLDLHEVLGSERGRALRDIVDPFSYRAVLTAPKLIVLATNDRYFPIDSANLYWDALEGPKYLLYLPNEQHSIDDYGRLIATLGALHRSATSATRLPEWEWEYRWTSDRLLLCVRGDPTPRRVEYWTAESSDRDFRDAVWSVASRGASNEKYLLDLRRPDAGYVAVFAEATFGRGRGAYSLSSNLAVLPAGGLNEIGPRPSGRPGVCGQLN